VDPSRLETSARQVYGNSVFESLYGTRLQEIPESRIRTLEDNASLDLGSSKLQFLHTRGHANHHFCIHDPDLSTIFTGDSFGLRYPDLQRHGLFVFPSTSPTDFDGLEALKTVDRIVGCGASSFYPTHFGRVDELHEAAGQLRRHLHFALELLGRVPVQSLSREGALESWFFAELRRFFEDISEQRSHSFDAIEWRHLELDLKLNAAGLAHAARKANQIQIP
jgi:glyoxylase-like metal-dependent hydrolase (beta-lactamase superfamily II)